LRALPLLWECSVSPSHISDEGFQVVAELYLAFFMNFLHHYAISYEFYEVLSVISSIAETCMFWREDLHSGRFTVLER